jgi:formate hydrogenlyase subunit 3/multisubunit Na+/H+ antiporter MnhD subunit
VVVGAASALGGQLLKTVQPDVKSQLGCSTVGQMGFMIMQAGLGFFGAAITHLILHGFYKAYQFPASGSRVAHESPTKSKSSGSTGPVGVAVIALVITGYMVWWRRRPPGAFGPPPKMGSLLRTVPIPLIGGFVVLLVLLPTLGVAFVAYLVLERLFRLVRRPAPAH